MKKVLVVLLSLAMVLGCFSFVGAASFTDVAATDANLTAIEVLAGLGVLEGDGNGSFRPEDGLKRVEACVIIDKMLGYGELGAIKTATSFTDVPASYWGSGYVAVAANLGLVSGYGDGTFGPEDELTYDQWLTIVVNALGYRSDVLVGKWPQNYEVKALNLKLVTTSQVGSAAATRSNVAAVAYKALSTERVEYDAKGTLVASGLDSLLESVFDDALKHKTEVVSYEYAIKGDDGDGTILADYVGQFGTGYYVEKNIDDDKDLEKVAVSFVPDTTVKAYTGTFDESEMTLTLADKTVYNVATDTGFYYGYNGAQADVTDFVDGTVTVYGTVSGKKLTAKSIIQWNATETYKVGPDEVKAIASAIKTVEKANAKLTTKKTTVDLKLGVDEYTYAISDAEKLAKNDVVTVYATGAGLVKKVVVSTATVSGSISKVSGTNYTIGGTVYQAAAAVDASLTADVLKASTKTGTFYLDAAGKLFAYAADTDTVTATKYAVVQKNSIASTAVTGSVYAAAKYTPAQVYLLTEDGTNAVYSVNKYYNGDDTKKPSTPIALADDALVVGDIVSYEVNADGELTAIAKVGTVKVNTTDVYKSASGILAGQLVADDVFVVKANTGSDKATNPYVKATTASIPATFTEDTSLYVVNATSKKIDVVRLGEVAVAAADTTVYTGFYTEKTYTTSLDADGANVYTINAVVNGAAKELTAAAVADFGALGTLTDIYTFTFNASKGTVTAAAKALDYYAVQNVSGLNIKYNDAYVNVASDAVVYVAQYDSSDAFESWEISTVSALEGLTEDNKVACYVQNKGSKDTYDVNVVFVVK